MMKDILCNTKWWGLYHNIMIRSSRSQATRGKQKNASKALWHFEVAELQSKWEAEMRKPPVLEGLWGLYSGKFCSRVETLLPWLWTQLVWGKWEQTISRVNKKIWAPMLFHGACHGQKAWMTGVCYYYISPHAFAGWWSDQPQNSKYDTSHSPITRGRQRIQRWNFHHIPPKSSSLGPCCISFSSWGEQEFTGSPFGKPLSWGKRALGRVPTSRFLASERWTEKGQVFVAYLESLKIGIVHSKCLFDKFRYFILMAL